MTFRDYLSQVFANGYTGTDDSMPDAESDWFGSLDSHDVIEWAEKWGNKQYAQGMIQGQKLHAKAFEAVMGLKAGEI